MSRPTPEAVRQQVLDLAAAGHTPRAIAAALKGVSRETARRIINAAQSAATGQPAGPATTLTPSSSPLPPAPVAPVPAGLTGAAADAWILDHEIGEVRAQLAEARARVRAGSTGHGLAALGQLLRGLLDRRAAMRPPEPPPQDEVIRRLRELDGEVIERIELHLEAAEKVSIDEVHAGQDWLADLQAFADRLPPPLADELRAKLERPWSARAAATAREAA